MCARGRDRRKGEFMRITVDFINERNETVIDELKKAHGDRCIIRQICDKYDLVTVINALYHACDDEDWPEEFTDFGWDYDIEDWLYQYFYNDCVNYVFDAIFGENHS